MQPCHVGARKSYRGGINEPRGGLKIAVTKGPTATISTQMLDRQGIHRVKPRAYRSHPFRRYCDIRPGDGAAGLCE